VLRGVPKAVVLVSFSSRNLRSESAVLAVSKVEPSKRCEEYVRAERVKACQSVQSYESVSSLSLEVTLPEPTLDLAQISA